MKSMRLPSILYAGVLMLSALPGCDTVDNPYKVAPRLSLPSDTLNGHVGIPVDTIRPTVTNNVETQEFWTFPELPAGLSIDPKTGAIGGVPESAVKGEYSVKAKNGYGSSVDLVLNVWIAPGKPEEFTAVFGDGGIVLSWELVPDATTYYVFRRNIGEDRFSRLVETTDTTHTDDSLEGGSTWEYYLVAVMDGLVSLTGDTISRTVRTKPNVNHPPEFQPIDTVLAQENEPMTVEISVIDLDGDSVTIWAKSKPESASFLDRTNGTGVMSWTPGFGVAGEHVIELLAWDGENTSAARFVISVESVNRPPAFVDLGNVTVGEGEELFLTVSAFDPDSQNVALSVKSGTLPSGADFKDNENGSAVVTWIPGPGSSGNYEVTFVVSDGQEEVEETIVLTVGNVLRPPELSFISDTTISENDLLNLIVHATHPDGEAISLSVQNKPTNASFVDSGNGTGVLSWRPSYTDSGMYQDIIARAILSGADTLADMVEFDIRVLNKDRPPVLEPVGDTVVSENELLNLTVSASDPDGDPVLYSIVGSPAGANFDVSTATFSWIPGYDQAGTYAVTFLATAGNLSDWERIEITVENMDQGVEFEPIDDQSVDEMEQLEFTVNAVDQDGDAVTYSAGDLPDGASFSSSGTFTWKPDYTQAGNYVVSFTASSGQNLATLDVSILVSNVNRPPVISGDPSTSAGKGNTYLFEPEVSDPDGDEVVLSFVDRPEGMELNGATVEWEIGWLSRFRIGTNDLQVVLEAKDANGGADTLTWYVDIVAHQWNSKAIELPEHYELRGVLNEDSLYGTGSHWSEITAKYGNGPWKVIKKVGETANDPMIQDVRLANRRIYVYAIWKWGGEGGLVSYSLNGENVTTIYESFTNPNDEFHYDIALSGETAIVYGKERDSYSIDFTLVGPEGDTAFNCSGACGFSPRDVSTGGDNIVVLGNGKSYTSGDGGRNWVENPVSGFQVSGDSNDGDTVFVLSSDSTLLQYRFRGSNGITYLGSVGSGVRQVKMISGYTGWFVSSDGTVYFTENGFGTKIKEQLPAGLGVDRLYVNGTTRRPYAYAGGKIFY